MHFWFPNIVWKWSNVNLKKCIVAFRANVDDVILAFPFSDTVA